MKPNHSPRGRKSVSHAFSCFLILGTVGLMKPLIATNRNHADSKLGAILNESVFVGSQFAKGISRLYLDLMSGEFQPPHGMVRSSQLGEFSNGLPKGMRKVGVGNSYSSTQTGKPAGTPISGHASARWMQEKSGVPTQSR